MWVLNWRVTVLASLALTAVGCGASGHSDSEAVPGVEYAALAAQAVEIKGRLFLRRELWTKEEFDRIVDQGRADQDSSVPAVLAAQLRSHRTDADGNYYIELEPNLELANAILRGDGLQETPAGLPREERTIIGTDNRTLVGSPMSYPYTTIAFNESRGSGVRIGQSTLYTAAHVVYDTQSANAWYCADGSTTANCNRPRWRFGVSGTSAFAGWTAYNCDGINIPTAFVNLTGTGNETNWSHWDFAVVDLAGCNAGNTGWLGTWILNDQDLLDVGAYSVGYPARATCPSGANGDTGYNSGGSVRGTDCPGTGSWPGSTYQLNNTTAPYAGAKNWSAYTTDVYAGSAYTIRSSVDITHGDSGGPLYYFGGGNRRVIGVSSLAPQAYNVWNRWTGEVYNWFDTYASGFPEDTF